MAESSHDGPDRELVPARRFEWERVVRRIKMRRGLKLIAMTLGSYASSDGGRVCPGRERLANVTGLTPRSVSNALVELRDLGLIERVREGYKYGRQGRSDEYRLTLPSDLLDSFRMLDPDDGTGEGGDTSKPAKAVKQTSPVRRGTGEAGRHEPVKSETEPVKSQTGTGEVGFTLPVQDQPVTTPDQDQASVQHTVTEGDADPWLADDGLDWSKKDHECNNGYLGWDDEGRPRPCTKCRPHLARVIPMFDRETA